MKHACAVCGLFFILCSQAFGQADQTPPAPSSQTSSSSSSSQASSSHTTPAPPPPPPPVLTTYEVAGGYNLRLFTQPNYTRIGLSGGFGSFQYNLFSRISAVVEVSTAFRNQGVNGNLSIYSVLVGPQIYPFRHRHKLIPFAHVLLGEGIYRNDYPRYAGFPRTIVTSEGFSWEAGGGVDIYHSARWEIRAIQLDFAPTKFLGQSENNYRASIGIVYRFGETK